MSSHDYLVHLYKDDTFLTEVRARKEPMLQQGPFGDQILEMVRANPDCTLEEVRQQLPNLHPFALYLEVERLRRLGHLRMVKNLRIINNRLVFSTALRLS